MTQNEVLSRVYALAESTAFPTVVEVMRYIDSRRQTFTPTYKLGLDGQEDVFTDIDTGAQELSLERLIELTPDFGIIAEEKGYSRPSQVPGHDVYWTVDPIDGTKAFVRREEHGVATMLSLVVDGRVVLACIGDICTGRVYYFCPSTPGAWLYPSIYRHGGSPQQLTHCPQPLRECGSLMGKPTFLFSPALQRLFRNHNPEGLLGEHETDRGSIGIRLARLWRGSVGVYLSRPYMETPWDNSPLIGFNERLGYVNLTPDPATGLFTEHTVTPPKEPRDGGVEYITLHRSHLPELRAWEAATRK